LEQIPRDVILKSNQSPRVAGCGIMLYHGSGGDEGMKIIDLGVMIVKAGFMYGKWKSSSEDTEFVSTGDENHD